MSSENKIQGQKKKGPLEFRREKGNAPEEKEGKGKGAGLLPGGRQHLTWWF